MYCTRTSMYGSNSCAIFGRKSILYIDYNVK